MFSLQYFSGMKSLKWEQMLEDYFDTKTIDQHNLESDLSLRQDTKSDINCSEQCKQGIFVEPMKWMGSRNPDFVNGDTCCEKIYCEKCNSKIGGFSWLKGIPCSCGTNMGPPGFYIQMSRIDRCTMITEVKASIKY